MKGRLEQAADVEAMVPNVLRLQIPHVVPVSTVGAVRDVGQLCLPTGSW